MTTENPRVTLGNNSAAMTPYEAVKAAITDLYQEARNFCDGAPIDSAALANEVERLEDDLKGAIKVADEARKTEAKPHDDAKDEIQERYNLLIGKNKAVKGIAILALEACQSALTPWKQEQLRLKNEAAAEARRIAEEKAEEARLAHMEARRVGDLEALEAAERQLKDAGRAERVANKAEKMVGVKTGLRVTYSAEIVDLTALARHVWVKDLAGINRMMQEWADAEVARFSSRAGEMTIPGVKIVKNENAR